MKNYLDKVEHILNKHKDDVLIRKYVSAIEYVSNGMLAFYYHKINEDVKAETYLSKPSFEDLPSKTRAAILALKSSCIMEYGPGGGEASKAALETIQTALELDSEELEWQFLKGKCIARARRYRGGAEPEPPSEEELTCLRKAAQSTELPSHLVFCAQSLLNYAVFSPNCKPTSPPNIAVRQMYISECVVLMRRAVTLGEHNPVILCRVAKGLMQQREPEVEELLERCALNALKLLPSSGMVNAVAGEYFHYRKQNMEKAYTYYSVAAHHHDFTTAYFKLFEVVFLTKSESELEDEIIRFFETRKDTHVERLWALPAVIAFYFFVQNNIIKAVQYCDEWILSTKLNDKVKSSHRSNHFVYTDDLAMDIVGEVQLELRNHSSSLASDNEEKMRSFLMTVNDARPDINIDEVTTSREKRIRKFLQTVRPYKKKELMENKFNVRTTFPTPRKPHAGPYFHRQSTS